MFSKQSKSYTNATSFSQTHLDLSKHPLFKIPEKNTSAKKVFSFSEDEEDYIIMDEATLMEETLQAIFPWVTHLALNNNDFGQRTVEELVIIFKAIPKHIQHLSLKANGLYYAGFNRINRNISDVQAFSNIVDALSKPYLSIDLSNNSLGNMNINKLIYLVSMMSPDLEKLKLCYNNLSVFFDFNLVGFFNHFPKKLKYLYLKGNDLFNSRDDESAANILNALPDSLIYLDVTNNGCWNSQIDIEERMVTIYPLLKQSIQNALNYDHDKPTFIAQKIDHMIFGKRQRYKDIKIKSSQLPFVISESLLEKLVHMLEKSNDCSTFFIAGLLLEGKIPSQIRRDFSASELRAYCEKRMNDAITLYMRAGSFMDLPSSEMLAINFLIAKRTASVIRPCLFAPAPDLSNRQDFTYSSNSYSP